MSPLGRNATVLTIDPDDRIVEDGAVLVEGFELVTADAGSLIGDAAAAAAAAAAAEAAGGRFVAKHGDFMAR